MATGNTHLVLDLVGFFAPSAALDRPSSFYPITPCRVVDTREPNGQTPAAPVRAGVKRSFDLSKAGCTPPPNGVQSVSMNITVVPKGPRLGYLTAWTNGYLQPFASTLNSPKGRIVSNAAIVAWGDFGYMDVYSTDDTELIVDVNGYFGM
jgi:hypothetical protein